MYFLNVHNGSHGKFTTAITLTLHASIASVDVRKMELMSYINIILVLFKRLLLIAYASSEGSGEPAHPRSLARTFAPRSYK